MIDAARRRDFPLLARRIGDRPLVYLDSAATAQKPAAVIDAMTAFYQRHNANVHRGVHTLAEEATEALEAARGAVARFLDAAGPQQIAFTSGTTEAVNLVARGWAEPRLKPGDEILVTELEHHSNLLPWQRAAARTGATLRAIPVDAGGRLQLDSLSALLTPRTKLLAFSQVSNVLGCELPAAELCAAARKVGAVTLIDAAQSAPHLPLDVRALGCDFLAFSGHKLLGPTGIGALWSSRLDEIEPQRLGGGMVREVHIDRATWADAPFCLEGGTPPIAEAAGLHAAIIYLQAIGMHSIAAHDRELAVNAHSTLSGIESLRLFGPPARVGAISFSLDGAHPHDVAAFLDERGIAVRAGNHCAQPLMRKLGVAGTVRASWHLYNTTDDLAALAEALRDAARALAR